MIDVSKHIIKLGALKKFIFQKIDGKYKDKTFEDHYLPKEIKSDVWEMNKLKIRPKYPVVITTHAYERGKERLGLSKREFAKLAVKAYTIGKDWEDNKNHFGSFVITKNTTPKVYGNYLFIFTENILKTVINKRA